MQHPTTKAITESLMSEAPALREQLNQVLEAEVAKYVASIEAFRKGETK